jgi:hypothetical protein
MRKTFLIFWHKFSLKLTTDQALFYQLIMIIRYSKHFLIQVDSLFLMQARFQNILGGGGGEGGVDYCGF